MAHCRKGYEDAVGAPADLENMKPLLQELLKISDLTRLKIHGPAEQLAKLRAPLADLEPQFFELEDGFCR